jgi:hypothetical protein
MQSKKRKRSIERVHFQLKHESKRRFVISVPPIPTHVVQSLCGTGTDSDDNGGGIGDHYRARTVPAVWSAEEEQYVPSTGQQHTHTHNTKYQSLAIALIVTFDTRCACQGRCVMR